MTAKQERVRVNKVSPEDIEDPELREIMNGLVSGINKSRERLERMQEENISFTELTELKKLAKEDDKEYRELNRRLKEYKKRKAS